MIRPDDSRPASHSVEATAIDSAPAQAPPAAVAEAATAVRLPEREAIPEIALPLPRAPGLHGRVYDEENSAPIGDARIMVHPQGTHSTLERVMWVTTAADGTFVLEDLAPGRIMLMAHAQGYAPRNVEIVARENSPPVEIGLSTGGVITGRLVAVDGTTPVAGMVELSSLDHGHGTGSSTGPAGEFDFQDLAPGRYQLMVRGEGGMTTREFVLATGERIDGIILVLTGGHAVRGMVTGWRPEELGHVRISLSHEAGGNTTDVRIDDRGAFVIPGVPPGRVYIAADSERRQMSKTIEMPADSDVTVNLEFPRGVRLSGRITRGGEPFPDVPVAPMPPPGVQPPVYLNGTSTSSEGTYVIEDVPPGRYVLMIERYWSGPVEVSGDTVFDFDVPGGQLSGRVLEIKGEPIMGAEVYIWPAEPDEAQRPQPFYSDDSGKFTLGGLEPGDFTLTVYKHGYEMHRKRISFDTHSRELTIQLREERCIEVTAHESGSGRPLRQLIAIEVIGTGRGSLLRLQLDEDGKGYLPSTLAGSTLRLMALDCEPTVVDSWNGSRLDLQLERAGAR